MSTTLRMTHLMWSTTVVMPMQHITRGCLWTISTWVITPTPDMHISTDSRSDSVMGIHPGTILIAILAITRPCMLRTITTLTFPSGDLTAVIVPMIPVAAGGT